MQTQTHIIQRQTLEVEISNLSQSWAWQERLSRFASGPLASRLAELFDKSVRSDEVIRLGRLELRADLYRMNDWEGELLAQIESQLLKAIQSAENKARYHDSTDRLGSFMAAFFYFLEKGRLPWWVSSNVSVGFENELKNWLKTAGQKAEWATKFRQAIRASEVRQRLLGQFSDETLRDLALVFLKIKESDIIDLQVFAKRIFKQTAAKQSELSRVFWEAIFSKPDESIVAILAEIVLNRLALQPAFFEKTALELKSLGGKDVGHLASESPAQFLEFVIENLGPNSLTKIAEPKHPFSEKTTENAGLKADSACFIRNAGVVILHPFLPAIFEKMGFAKQGKMKKPERAVHLLQYLATGRMGDMEHELVLNKVLCGVPLDQPLERQINLTKKEKTEADGLLRAVVGHWSALGNTSIDGLRGTFLCREGKLSQKPNGNWLLQVEQQTVDLLLSKMPWIFSTIKMPWMQEMLTVEWS